jgi:hypothetical protein
MLTPRLRPYACFALFASPLLIAYAETILDDWQANPGGF